MSNDLKSLFDDFAKVLKKSQRYNFAGSVIIYTATVDAQLGTLIEMIIKNSNARLRRTMIENSDLAMKIDIAYAFGAIDHAFYVKLHKLRDIRSVFAHDPAANFQHKDVKPLLEILHGKKVEGPAHQAYSAAIAKIADEMGSCIEAVKQAK